MRRTENLSRNETGHRCEKGIDQGSGTERQIDNF